MSAAHEDNAETRGLMSVLGAMAATGPTAWRAESPSSDIDLSAVNWAVMTTRSRAQLFRKEGEGRDGTITLKSANRDGSEQFRGPSYQLTASHLRAPCWTVFASYEDALQAVESHE